MTHHPVRLAAATLAAALALAGCQPNAAAPPAPIAEATPAPAASPAASPAAAAYDPPRMTPEEAQAAIARGEAIVFVDVRFAHNFAEERIAGAVSAPWGELATGHAMLPKDKLLLLYCT